MRPRTDEILKSVLWTFDEWIVPDVTTPYAKSQTLTMGNLMRHVILRVELEGDLLFEDNRDLRDVLARSGEYIDGLEPGSDALRKAGSEITEALAKSFHGGDVYPSVARLIEEATALRWALSHAIETLQGVRDTLAGDAAYTQARQSIRDYLGRQLDREGQMIEPAFTADRR